MLVPGLKWMIFFSSAAAQKGIKTVIVERGSSLDLGPFSVQLTGFDSMDHLDPTITKESRTESTLCAISGKTLGK